MNNLFIGNQNSILRYRILKYWETHYSQTAVILIIADFFPILSHPGPAGNLYRSRTITTRIIFTVNTKPAGTVFAVPAGFVYVECSFKFKLCKIKFHMLVIIHKFTRKKRALL